MLYSILQWGLRHFFAKIFPLEVHGKENVPEKGGVILAGNHISNFDPPFLATYLDRPVAYMAKSELFAIPIFNTAIKACHAFPVERGKGDRQAIKRAITTLKQGACLGIFPEGRRSRDGKLHEPKIGVALLAAISKAPVIPVAITGTDKIFAREKYFPPLSISYGTPLIYSYKNKDKENLMAFAHAIMQEIQKMQERQGEKMQ